MGKKILIIGHAFIVKTNRDVWRSLSHDNDICVDVVIPEVWNSNLVGKITANSESFLNYKVIPLPVYFRGKGSFYFYHLYSMFKVINHKRYDCIIINQETWALSVFFFNLTSLFTINRKSKKLLMIAQNLKKPSLRFLLPFEKFNALFFDRILGCCHEIKDVLSWKNINTKWGYLPLYYSNKNEKSFESLGKTRITLGFLGRLSSEKGIHQLLEMYKRLNHEKYKLLIAGDGPEKEIIQNSAANYIGVLKHDNVSSFYDKIDILVVPSLTTSFWKEQFGRVIVEAVSHGKIVMSSDSGAIPEVMGTIGLDYIFKENNVESMLETLNKIEDDNNTNRLYEKMYEAQVLNKKNFSDYAFVGRVKEYGL